MKTLNVYFHAVHFLNKPTMFLIKKRQNVIAVSFRIMNTWDFSVQSSAASQVSKSYSGLIFSFNLIVAPNYIHLILLCIFAFELLQK